MWNVIYWPLQGLQHPQHAIKSWWNVLADSYALLTIRLAGALAPGQDGSTHIPNNSFIFPQYEEVEIQLKTKTHSLLQKRVNEFQDLRVSMLLHHKIQWYTTY